jgi:DNA transformation protein and related proteins
MKKLEDYPNIGVGMAAQLNEIGIFNFLQLKQMGSRKVIIRMREYNQKMDLQTFFRLEACIREIPWYQLTKLERIELKKFYTSLDRHLET